MYREAVFYYTIRTSHAAEFSLYDASALIIYTVNVQVFALNHTLNKTKHIQSIFKILLAARSDKQTQHIKYLK